MPHSTYTTHRAALLIPALLLCSAIIAPAQPTVAQSTGSISGIVFGPPGPYGHGLAGAVVSANLVSAPPRPTGNTSATPQLRAITNSNGAFTISQVPIGDYVLCAQHPLVEALNPCAWGPNVRVQIAAGKMTAPSQSIRLAQAAVLQVHMDDPAGHLATHEGKTKGASMMVGITTPSGFQPLQKTVSNATSREYRLLVPYDKPLNLAVFSSFFKVNDNNGVARGAQPVTPGAAKAAVSAPLTVTFSQGVQAKPVTLHVVGAGK